MNTTPIAFESMGVRSMATLVEAGGVKILLDPSAALGPLRYGLPPAVEELRALELAKERIRGIASGCGILVVTHYHYDHHDPDESFYRGKVVLAKDVKEKINYSQRSRGNYFKRQVEDECKLVFADGRSFVFDDVRLTFSKPFPHGPEGTKLGFVLMCLIEYEGESVLFGSDTQGPVSSGARDWIIEQKPSLLVMDGPPTYFLGYRFSVGDLSKAKENMLELIRQTKAKIILDHHLLRDLKYREHFKEVYDTRRVVSAAGFLGLEDNLLEARRKELWAAARKTGR